MSDTLTASQQLQAQLTAVPETQEALPESSLPEKYHEVYRLRLAGRGVQELANSYGVDRVTIWRWVNAVKQEAAEQIATEPLLNLITEECSRLRDLETQAREAALNTKSDRAKANYLSEARRALMSRANLLVTTGVFPKQAERLYQITQEMKPDDGGYPEQPLRSREESLAELVDHMQRGRLLS